MAKKKAMSRERVCQVGDNVKGRPCCQLNLVKEEPCQNESVFKIGSMCQDEYHTNISTRLFPLATSKACNNPRLVLPKFLIFKA